MRPLNFTPFQNSDSYKLSHWGQYPEGTNYIYANMTPRYSLRDGIDRFVFFGLQAFLGQLATTFNMDFFEKDRVVAMSEFHDFYTRFFGSPPSQKQLASVRDLYDLRYLPIRVHALPEGSVVPHGIPVLTVESTHPTLFWFSQWIESWMSSEIWQLSTSATTAFYYRQVFNAYARDTSDEDFMPAFQGHDFSMRGMPGLEAGRASAAAHLLSFTGSDSLAAFRWIDCWYPGTPDTELLGTSVPATEHSVMCAGEEGGEFQTYERLLDLYPTGIISVVSDTWDFWQVVTEYLPELKGRIMARDGKLVIRPDSGDPADILCGDPNANTEHERQGLIQCLWNVFGGTVNSKGYKQLDGHVGAIYGDSITLDRQEDILHRLAVKGFSSTNVVLGIGSFTYQYVTRDTHGIAIKATVVGNATGKHPISKSPKTGDGSKKSSRGFLAVERDDDGEYFLLDGIEEPVQSLLEPVFCDGKMLRTQSFSQVREVVNAHRS